MFRARSGTCRESPGGGAGSTSLVAASRAEWRTSNIAFSCRDNAGRLKTGLPTTGVGSQPQFVATAWRGRTLACASLQNPRVCEGECCSASIKKSAAFPPPSSAPRRQAALVRPSPSRRFNPVAAMHSVRARHAVLNRVLAARPFAAKAHVSISFVGDKVS
eukprot:scaffold43030_cov59-Phaeocystis_antarctica.AAC.2